MTGRRGRLALALFGLALACVVVRAPPVRAQSLPSHLDPTFGTGGRVTTVVGPGTSYAHGVAIQADGGIVLAGESGSPGASDFALVRYHPDGRLDTSFDVDGKVTTDFGAEDGASAVAVQSDGRIVAAGGTRIGVFGQFALARYNTDGSLDTGFDGDGKATTAFIGDSRAFGVALQPDGKIVAAGRSFGSGFFDTVFALARYNTDGSLDASFDGDGKVTTQVSRMSEAFAVAIQDDGKIVAAGVGSAFNDFALVRYNADGSLDTSFDGDGRVVTDFGGGVDRAYAVAIAADGKIVAAGLAHWFSPNRPGGFGLARYNTDGSIDPGFGGNGRMVAQFTGHGQELATGLALRADGTIVAVGSAFINNDREFAIAPFRVDGSPVPGGRVMTGFGSGSDDSARAVAVHTDGKIVAVGGAGSCATPCLFAAARYVVAPAR